MHSVKTDKEIIQAIQQGGSGLEATIKDLYLDNKVKAAVIRHVTINSGNTADGEDIFHDGIRVLILNIRGGKFKGIGELNNYLIRICKNLWYNKFNRRINLKRIKNEQFSAIEKPTDSVEDELIQMEDSTLLKDVLSQIGRTCQSLLGFWSLGYSFAEIGNKMELKEATARKRKYDCLKKLTELIMDKPELVHALKQILKS